METEFDLARRKAMFKRMLEICEREDPAYTVLHQTATFTAKRKDIAWKAAPAFADGLPRRQLPHGLRRADRCVSWANRSSTSRSLTVDFDDGQRVVRALHGVDLAIRSGEAVGLVGEIGLAARA